MLTARAWRFRALRAGCALRRGGVALYPTEGVWGLGCDPADARALARLLAIKRRPAAKGLILLAARPADLRRYVRLPARWPAPGPRATTYVLPARRAAPALLRGRHRTLAARVTTHGPAAALCRAAGGAITSTSANRSGARPPAGRWAVLRQFGPQVDAVLCAPLGGQSRPSRIFDTLSGQWIRP